MNDFSTRGPTRLLAEIGASAVSNSKIYAFCLGLPGRFAPKTARFARGRFNARNNRTQQTHATHARNKLVQRPIRSENTQNRVLPPKTSPIEQISDRCEPKNSNLQRVTLQHRWIPNTAKSSKKAKGKVPDISNQSFQFARSPGLLLSAASPFSFRARAKIRAVKFWKKSSKKADTANVSSNCLKIA